MLALLILFWNLKNIKKITTISRKSKKKDDSKINIPENIRIKENTKLYDINNNKELIFENSGNINKKKNIYSVSICFFLYILRCPNKICWIHPHHFGYNNYF